VGLPPLAQVRDVTNRLPGSAEVEPIRLTALLADASAAVRRFTKQTFTVAQSTVNLRPVNNRLRLNNRPVVSVDDVSIWSRGAAAPSSFAGWFWDGGNEIQLPSPDQVINLSEDVTDILRGQSPMCRVTYTHGYAEVPEDVVAIACAMATRIITAPGLGGIISETVGEYSYRLADTAAQGAMALTDAEKKILASYRPSPMTSIELRG
jgi:hypothetical protein